MILALLSLACGKTCGPGTVDKDGVCVAADDTADSGSEDSGGADGDSAEDSDEDSGDDSGDDSGADSGSDSGTDTGSDSGTDSGGDTSPCAPPDAWTGDIDPALYTTTAYDASYDVGLTEMIPYFPDGSGSSSYSDISFLVYGATVVAYSPEDNHIFVADAYATFPVIVSGSGPSSATVGDKVGFASDWLESTAGEHHILYVDGWTVLSSDNPVYVRELGAENVDYDTTWGQMTHVYGEITAVSAWNCGTSRKCYILNHDGTDDLVRVPSANDYGLDPDYDGGLCAEIVAPVSVYESSDGDANFLDVLQAGWMRVWALP